MKKLLLILILFTTYKASLAQAFLQSPIEGEQRKDWMIVNYVDWEVTDFKDHNCGSKSYDGHQGTDFTLRSFKQMDSGVNVLAAAAGRVTFIHDGEFDRETEGIISKKLGNYVAINHGNAYYSYYGHLKKNSILVSEGDSVEAGDIIAQVGSSGNSTDPHLHFELWYDSTFVVDPYSGLCGNLSSLWLNTEEYDTSLGVFESGITLQNDLDINDLRERNVNLERPFTITPSSDSSLNFWAHLYGVRAGKELSLTWYTPSNAKWFSYTITLDRDYWYYYYWSFINHQDLAEGTWSVKLEYDGAEVLAETFKVTTTADIAIQKNDYACKQLSRTTTKLLIENAEFHNLKITDMYGQQVSKITTPGIYIFRFETENGTCIDKRFVD